MNQYRRIMNSISNVILVVTFILSIKAYYESEIKDSLETTDNPFESNESHFESTKIRRYKDRLNNKYLDDDPDIAAEQKRPGSDNVRIMQ